MRMSDFIPWILLGAERPGTLIVDAGRRRPPCGVKRLVATVALAATVAGCWGGGAAEQAADRFVDTYYVRIDPGEALALTSAEARSKLEKELQRLSEMGPVDAGDRPQIHAALRDRRVEEGAATFTYEIQSISDGVSQLTVDVSVMERGGQWLVTDFVERGHQ
jgi:hypothetical protein